MGTTPKRAIPYPEPTDPVAAGADNMKALALALDPLLVGSSVKNSGGTGKLLIQAGEVVNATPSAAGDVVVTFPLAFASAPIVIAGNNRADTYVHCTSWQITLTTFVIKFLSSAGPVGGPGFYAHWIAIGYAA